MLNETPEPVTTTNRNVTIIEPDDDMTADDESDEKLCITSGTRTREREKTDTKVNTEMSVVVSHFAKLNDSGDVKAMTDSERRRGVEIARPFRLRAH